MRAVSFVTLLFVLFIEACSSCSSDPDAKDIAEALRDRLTDALVFEDGSIEPGEPPTGDDDPALPQIRQVLAPSEFRLGADFSIKLSSGYENYENVDKTIVYVKGASKHIVVPGELTPRGTMYFMNLFGNLLDDAELKDQSFTLQFALQTKDGKTGAYRDADMIVPEDAPECEDDICCNGGVWVEEGDVCKTDADDLFCTADTCDADRQCVSELLEGFCLIEGKCLFKDESPEDNPCLICDPDNDKEAFSFAEDDTPCDSGDGEGSGVCVSGVCGSVLGDRMLESMNVEGTDILDGEPPEGSEDRESPQIVEMLVPEELRIGASFSVILVTDFADPNEVTGVVIVVDGATKFIIYSRTAKAGNLSRIVLDGLLIENEQLKGHSFTIEFALQTRDGKTGGYASSKISVPYDPPECEFAPCCNGGAWLAVGSRCDDGNLCSFNDLCDDNRICRGSEISCVSDAGDCGIHRECNGSRECSEFLPPEGTECDDGDPCTYATSCDGQGNCLGQTVVCESDEEACGLQRVCDGSSRCNEFYPGVETSCSDEDLCTYGDSCNGEGGCVGTPIFCPDSEGICGPRRECNGTAQCTENFPSAEMQCDDDDACTFDDRCNGSGQCAGTPVVCEDDPGFCGADRNCNGTSQCDVSFPGRELSCDDSDDCTYNDHCDGQGACSGTPIECNDEPGTCSVRRECNGTNTCTETYPALGTNCDDRDLCTYDDSCDGYGNCVGIDAGCSNANPCALEQCNGTSVCSVVYPEAGTGCDDEDLCTYDDKCDGAGICIGIAITCYTDDSCGLQQQCDGTANCSEWYPGNYKECDDSDPCTYDDRCDGSGGCSGTPITCVDDNTVCGADRVCNGTSECQVDFPGTEQSCDDNEACTFDDRCNGAGNCMGSVIVCESGPPPCGIIKTCNGTATCDSYYPGNEVHCDDLNICTYDDICDGAGMCEGLEIDCSDQHQHCDGTDTCACDDGWFDCSATMPGCEQIQNKDHCSGCNDGCFTLNTPPHSDDACDSGTCIYQCDAGYADCNDNLPDPPFTPGTSDGCETNIKDNDWDNCGACGRKCSDLLGGNDIVDDCTDYECIFICDTAYHNYGDCNNDLGQVGGDGCETNMEDSVEHCGNCNNDCNDLTAPVPPSHSHWSCKSGICDFECDVGWEDGDGDLANPSGNGCETYTG